MKTQDFLIHTLKGTTTKTIQSLFSNGWRAGVSGSVHSLYDPDGKRAAFAFSWQGLLIEAEKLMR